MPDYQNQYTVLEIIFRLHGHGNKVPPTMSDEELVLAEYFPLIALHPEVFKLIVRGDKGYDEFDNRTQRGRWELQVERHGFYDEPTVIKGLLDSWYVHNTDWLTFIAKAEQLVSKQNRGSTTNVIGSLDFKDIGYRKAFDDLAKYKAQFHVDRLTRIVELYRQNRFWDNQTALATKVKIGDVQGLAPFNPQAYDDDFKVEVKKEIKRLLMDHTGITNEEIVLKLYRITGIKDDPEDNIMQRDPKKRTRNTLDDWIKEVAHRPKGRPPKTQ